MKMTFYQHKVCWRKVCWRTSTRV